MIYNAIQRGKKALILTHRSELLTQAGGALQRLNITPQDINPALKKLDPNAPLSVGMAQTLKRRIEKDDYKEWLLSLDIVIVDEAHTQDSDKILDCLSEDCFVIGATATPYREHNARQLKTIYSEIIEEVKISTLIDEGYLAVPKYFGVPTNLKGLKTKGGDYDLEQMGKMFNERKLYSGVYNNYMDKCDGKKAIIFSPNVEASIVLTDEFTRYGLPIKHIDANTPKKDRDNALKWFKETPGALISNVGILNAGFDEQSIEVVILYRATKSISLYLQMCGRGSRTTDTKKEFMIMDFGENIREHGYWHDERSWSLETKKKRKSGTAAEKECGYCTAKVPVSLKICPYCQNEFPEKEKDEVEQIVDLVKLMDYREILEVAKNANFAQLEAIAKAKGYKSTWIYHQLRTEADIKAYAKFKKYHWKWSQYRISQLKIK